jgi:DNA invertase Pin-like site-specific DNA recombinase
LVVDKIFADISSIIIFASKKNDKVMKGAIYSRVSTEQQDYSKQTNELKDYAKRNGIEVVYVFEEKESGFNNNRPEFEKLRKLTKQDIDIILVWEISRISRRAIYLQQQVQEFTDKGICIYAKKDGFSTLNDDGSVNASTKMLIGFASIIAEQEAATLKERTISSKRNKILREGKSYTYYAPYGYDYSKETKMLSINEKQAQVVKRIFQLSIDGYSTERIAILLNAEKIPTKGKKENWTAGTVCNMLTNPVYKGEANYTLKKEKKAGSTYCKPMEVVTISTPAIIEKEQFELSLQKLAERTKRSNSFGTKYNPLLRGLIHCPHCDVKYVYNFGTNQYLCVNKYKKASNKNVHCTAKCISNKLDSIVWNVVKTFFYKELAAGKAQEQIEPLQAEIESYKRQILLLDGKQSELTARANIIVDAAIEIKIQFPNMPDLYANKMKEVEEINKEASKYQKEKERLEKLIHSNESRIKNINRASKESALVESITDETEKYDLVHKAIDKIMIFGEGKTSIIIVTFSTGQTIYLGYSSKSNSKYYTIFYPSSDIYFDIQTNKGYINHLKEKATINSDGSIYLGDLTGEVKEYSIIDFVNYLDIEENRRYY